MLGRFLRMVVLLGIGMQSLEGTGPDGIVEITLDNVGVIAVAVFFVDDYFILVFREKKHFFLLFIYEAVRLVVIHEVVLLLLFEIFSLDIYDVVEDRDFEFRAE